MAFRKHWYCIVLSLGIIGIAGISNTCSPEVGTSDRRVNRHAQAFDKRDAARPGASRDASGLGDLGSLAPEGVRLVSLGTGDEHLHEWEAFARKLAQQAPEEGIRWLAVQPETDNIKHALVAFALELYRTDPDMGIKLLDRVLPGSSSLRSSYCAGLLKAAADRSPEDAVQLAGRVALTPQEKDSLLRGLAGRLYGGFDHSAIMKMAALIPRQTDAVLVGDALYEVWSRDPTAAQEQMDLISDQQLVAEACNSLLAKLGKSQPEKAAEWVNSLPEGDVRDSSAAGLARALSRTDPINSVRWAISVNDERLRNASLSTLLGPAIGKDFVATKEIIATSSLPEAEKAKWMQFSEEALPVWKQP